MVTKKFNPDYQPKNSTELIIYQLGEVKNVMENMNTKFDAYKDAMDLRVRALENFQAAQVAQDRDQPKVDVQKIILAAFSLVSTVVAIAFGIRFYSGK